MRGRIRSITPAPDTALLLLLWAGMATLCWRWTQLNGLMDGYQNEYLHVGNALDLWDALQERDGYNLGYLLSSNYWPPLFYLWPAPLFALSGASYQAMVLSNLGHLGVMLWSSWRLGRTLGGAQAARWSVVLLCLYPGVYGSLTRYEPNLALIAWTTLGALCLVECRDFTRRRWSLGFGLVLGASLMLDRLSTGIFLGPIAIALALRSWLRGPRAARRNIAAAIGLTLLLAGPWYLEFMQHHLDEILSQGGVGEIDSQGDWTEQREMWDWRNWSYYGLHLLDAQAGLLAGGVSLLALLSAYRHPRARMLWMLILPAVALFSLIQKKQVYYTLPILGCLAALTGCFLSRRPRLGPLLGWLLILSGLHQMGYRQWGRGLPLPQSVSELVGGQILPAEWVDRRHPLARPPLPRDFPAERLRDALSGEGDVLAFSKDHQWFEGYLVLLLRESHAGHSVRGLISDPRGSYEWGRMATAVVTISEGPASWPGESEVNAAFRDQQQDPQKLPPLAELMEALRDDFSLAGQWPLREGRQLSLYLRRRP